MFRDRPEATNPAVEAARIREVTERINAAADPTATERCFIVLGAARGGTSMVAGLLSLMGLPMGERLDRGTNEDLDIIDWRNRGYRTDLSAMRTALAADIDALETLIEARKAAQPIWGWKDPMAAAYLEAIAPKLPAPHAILVLRDPAAVAQRRTRRDSTPYGQALRATLEVYAAALDAVESVGLPTLIVSYERSLRAPRQLVDDIIDFTGVHDGSLTREQLTLFVEPDRVHSDIGEFRAFAKAGRLSED